MPARFTSRLIVVPTDEGRVRVQYGPLCDGQSILEVAGPGIVNPPVEDMTAEEYDEWQFDLCAGTGYSLNYGRTELGSALVEARRTFEDRIPPGSVRAVLQWATDPAGEKRLIVVVENEWTHVIPRFWLATVCQNEFPDQMKLGEVQAFGLGGSESFFDEVPGEFKRSNADASQVERRQVEYLDPIHRSSKDLIPGRPRGFALDSRILPVVRKRADVASPEAHWIALLTDGYEFDRVPGRDVATFLQTE